MRIAATTNAPVERLPAPVNILATRVPLEVLLLTGGDCRPKRGGARRAPTSWAPEQLPGFVKCVASRPSLGFVPDLFIAECPLLFLVGVVLLVGVVGGFFPSPRSLKNCVPHIWQLALIEGGEGIFLDFGATDLA